MSYVASLTDALLLRSRFSWDGCDFGLAIGERRCTIGVDGFSENKREGIRTAGGGLVVAKCVVVNFPE